MKSHRNHVVFVVPIYLPAAIDGSGMVIRHLAEESVRRGKKVTIITSDALTSRHWYDPFFGKKVDIRNEYINGVRIVRLRTAWVLSSFLFILAGIFRFFNVRGKIADVVYAYYFGPYMVGLSGAMEESHPDICIFCPFPCGFCVTASNIAKRLGIEYALIPFFKPNNPLFTNPLIVSVLKSASIVFSPTATEIELMKQYASEPVYRLLPSSIDTDAIDKRKLEIQNHAKKLRKLKPYNGKHVILFVGAKGVRKGALDAASAIQLVKDTSCILAAMGPASPEWNGYRKVHPSVRIIDVGYQKDAMKYAYFSIADAVILPSVSDNFPLVFPESWYFKKPVIAYDYFSMKEILHDGSGILVPLGNTVQLAKAIETIIHNPLKAQQIGRKGYSKIQNYSIAEVTTDFWEGLGDGRI